MVPDGRTDVMDGRRTDDAKNYIPPTLLGNNNPNVDVVNINQNAYIKFGEILFICSQDIERKRNLGLNQGP